MGVAKILAPLTGSERDEIVLATAFAAAEPFSAHVACLFVHPDPRLAVPFVGMPVSPDVVQDIVDAAAEISRDAEKRARDMLAAAAAKAGADIVAHPRKENRVTCSLHESQGLFFRAVAQAAELSDLVAFGVIAGLQAPELSDGFVEVLTRAGRPMLLSAQAPARLARRIVIGWDGGPSASRAVSAALPFLKKAEAVEVLAVRHAERDAIDAKELHEYLSLHGIASTQRLVVQGARAIGEALLEGAAGADLLVTGAYSRGPLRESMFGGATVHLRSHATLPILMAH